MYSESHQVQVEFRTGVQICTIGNQGTSWRLRTEDNEILYTSHRELDGKCVITHTTEMLHTQNHMNVVRIHTNLQRIRTLSM